LLDIVLLNNILIKTFIYKIIYCINTNSGKFTMDDGQDPVEFDMSFSTNTRINYNLWQCNLASTQRDPHKWYFSCKNLFKEIVTDLKDIEFCNHLLMEDETVIALEAYDNYT